MTILKTPSESDATGVVAGIYAGDREAQGFVSEHTRVMALNPEAFAAWEQLVPAIAQPLGFRRYELATLAAALGARSTHCRLAHGERLLDEFPEDELIRIATDYRRAGLSDAEVVMMKFAGKISTDAASMTDADSIRLRIRDSAIVRLSTSPLPRRHAIITLEPRKRSGPRSMTSPRLAPGCGALSYRGCERANANGSWAGRKLSHP